MAIEHKAPEVPTPLRVMITFESTGWFDTSEEERTTKILPLLKKVTDGWKDEGAVLIGTMDKDIFTAGHASNGWHAIFIYDIPTLQAVTNITHSFRATGLDRYFRLEATLGRKFFMLEND